MRWRPRSIRWQMLSGLLLLETLSIAMFAVIVARQQNEESSARAHSRLTYEAESLAYQSSEALAREMPGWLDLSVRMKGEAPSIAVAKVTDPAGNVLSFSEGDKSRAQLEPAERGNPTVNRRQSGMPGSAARSLGMRQGDLCRQHDARHCVGGIRRESSTRAASGPPQRH